MPVPTRQIQVGVVKSQFDELIDRHAEAYLAAYPEIKEFSTFEKSGTFNYYIGMVWTSDNEKPDPQQLKIRGSQTIAKNRMLELDTSSIDSEQLFFPGQIVAFQADPYLKKQLTVKKFLDPIRIAPPMKKINTDDRINLMIVSGPYMKPEQEDWSLFDSLISNIKSNEVTHVIMIGPFVDLENKSIRAQYDTNWTLLIDKLLEGLYDHACEVFIVPSQRDILASYLSANYFYPCPRLEINLNIREGISPKCKISSVSDPAQIDLGGLYLDVTSVEVLLHFNRCSAFVKRGPGFMFIPAFRHILTHGIYPIYPSPNDVAIDYPNLAKHNHLDRLAPHIVVLPTRFNTSSVHEVENRLVVAIHKCCVTRHALLIEIPKIESTDSEPINSVVLSKYEHRLIDLSGLFKSSQEKRDSED